jgi:diguanylate cyclase (GGDEF)-like protein
MSSPKSPTAIIEGIPFVWEPEHGTCSMGDQPALMMWINSTLAHMMDGMQKMVGTERFLLSLQSSGRHGIDEDWGIIQSVPIFEEGFAKIAATAAAAGWGRWSIVSLDHEKKVCVFRAEQTWEARYQEALGVIWGSALLAGKFSGYAGRLFGTNCWSRQTAFIANGDPFDEFYVEPSPITVEEELDRLLWENKATQADMAVTLEKLRTEVQERKLAEETVQRLAYYDSMTGLGNRRMLFDRLHKEAQRPADDRGFGALLFIDVDHFKTLNDSLGHSAGDEMLRQAAERIRLVLRPMDTATRIGGDEFVVLLPDLAEDKGTASERSIETAELIRRLLAEKFILGHYEHFVTASIGIYYFGPNDWEDAETPLRLADISLFRAKQTGRNTVCVYSTDMQEDAALQLNLENALKGADPDREFQLFFQPQVNQLGKLTGLEALLRWKHPEYSHVPMDVVIRVAEHSGAIFALSDWVMRESLSHLKRWVARGLPEGFDHLAVNIGTGQFTHVNFVHHLRAWLDEFDIDPKLLILEITESHLLEDKAIVHENATALEALGVRLSLDDFGTGYSSLSYIKRLPIDQIKIDKSFVFKVLTDSNDQVIVETILGMARRFNLNVVAEGVETIEQMTWLSERSANLRYQGYLFSRPVPANELGKYGISAV